MMRLFLEHIPLDECKKIIFLTTEPWLMNIYFYRLWGEHGQAKLDSCHVCLVNATTLGTEILKSLVLPGIGAFTIVDGNMICDADLETKYV